MLELDMESLYLKSTSTVNTFLTQPGKTSEILKSTSLERQNCLMNKGLKSASYVQKNSLISTRNSFLDSAGTGPTLRQQRRLSLENTFLKRKQDVQQPLLTSNPKKFHSEIKGKGDVLERQTSVASSINDGLAPKYQLESFRETPVRTESFASKDLKCDMRDVGREQLAVKASFLSMVSTSLVNKPAYKNKNDLTRQYLLQQAEVIAEFDPEFILKVALYTRQDLNIRTTANFLLAVAANLDVCKNYLRRYYVPSIRLPSDWIEVAEIYQTFENKKLKAGSLPAMLRKEMKARFSTFDEYQLAKYNKKKRKRKEGSSKINEEQSSDQEDEGEIVLDEPERDLEKAAFSMKRLIRLIHLKEPHLSVMSLLGKKYPSSAEEFRSSGLSGTWDAEKAGIRLKLPVPFTWETQLAEKGNNAAVWEALLDSKKLPYMAMLRNLCNLLRANISPKHNKTVMNLLSNKELVVKSRQFPLSFYSAYKSVSALFDKWTNRPKTPPRIEQNKGKRVLNVKWLIHKKSQKRLINIDHAVIQQYIASLEKAVQISVEKNLNPVPGHTLVICDLLLIEKEKLREEGILLSLMCLYACEKCELKVIDVNGWNSEELEKESLLSNLQNIFERYPESMVADFVEPAYNEIFQSELNRYLSTSVVQQKQLDNIIVVTDKSVFKETTGPEILKSFLHKYRNLVNSQLLCVQVDLTGSKCDSLPDNPLDVQLGGASDQLLRFLAEKGTEAQVTYVENIDKGYKLAPLPKSLLPPEAPADIFLDLDSQILPKWRTVRVFISSTFRDMHGERDILVRYVFPELRARARDHCIHVHEVDLRWGITQEEAESNKSLEMCLSEVSRSQLFVGILGERYGTVSPTQSLPRDLSWVLEYPSGASVTELEIYAAALAQPKAVIGRAFFYIRDSAFHLNIPSEHQSDFLAESTLSSQKMELLKERIRKSGLEIYDSYPCQWGGTVNGIPIASGLENFGQRVLDNLWNSIQRHFVDEKENKADEHPMALKEPTISSLVPLVGRETQIASFIAAMDNSEVDTIFITGKTGSGKSEFLLYLQNNVLKSDAFLCDFGEKQEFETILDVFRYFWKAVTKRFNLSVTLPVQDETLGSMFWKVITSAADKSPTGGIKLIFDGVDRLKRHQDQSLVWIPASLNKNVMIVLSAGEHDLCQRAIQDRMKADRNVCTITMPALSIADRKCVVSAILSQNSKALSQDAFDNQMLQLVTKRDAGYPLYMQMACRQLRLFGLFENLGDKIRSLPQTLPQLIQDSLHQLENTFGKSLVQNSLCFISLAQEGLEEVELKMLLSVYFSNPVTEMNVNELKFLFTSLPPDQQISPMMFASLARSLRDYLDMNDNNKRMARFKVSNSEVSKAVRTRYLGSLSVKTAAVYHKVLAGLFLSEADPSSKSGRWDGRSSEAFRAIPHHLISSGCLQELSRIFCSLVFLSASFTSNSALALSNRFSAFAESGQNDKTFIQFWSDPRVNEYLAFLKRNVDTTGMCYPLLIQQALCEPQSSSVYKEAYQLKAELNVFLSKEEFEKNCCERKMTDFTSALCVSSDKEGRYLALGGSDGTCLLLEEKSGRLLHSFLGHKQAVCAVGFVGSHMLCTASLDGTLSLWNVHKGIRNFVLSGHVCRVTACCSDSGGNSLISAGWDHHIRIWALRDGRLLSSIDNKSPVNCISHHPTQSVVASGDWTGKVKLWDLDTLTRKAVFNGHTCSVTCATFSNDGALLASGSLNGEVFIWSSISGIPISKPGVHLYSVKDLAFNGSSLISASTNGKLKVWNNHWNHQKWRRDIPDKIQVIQFISEDILAIGCRQGTISVLSSDGKIICSESVGESIICISKYCHSVGSKAFGILIGTYSGHVKLLQISELNKPSPSVDVICYDQPISCLSSSRGWIYTGFASGQLATINIDGTQRNSEDLTKDLFYAHHGPLTAIIEISNKKLITVSHDKTVKLWKMNLNRSSLTLLMNFENCHNDWITSASFSRTLSLLVTGSRNSSLKIWDLKTGMEKYVLDDFKEPVSSVEFVIGSNLIVCCGCSGSLGVWNENGSLIILLPSPLDRTIITACLFKTSLSSLVDVKSLDFKSFMVTADTENSFSLRTPFKLNMSSQLVGHTKAVLGCCLSKSRTLVSTSMDRSLCWWTLEDETVSEAITDSIHQGSEVTAVDISVLGQRGLSADSAGIIALWDLTGDKMQLICHLSHPHGSIPVASFRNAIGTKLAYTAVIGEETILYQCSEHEQVFREDKNELLKSEVTSMTFSSQHECLVWADRNGFVGLTDSSNSSGHKLTKDWIMKVKIHPQDKEKFFIANCDGSVELISASFAAQVQGSKLLLLAPDEKRFITSLDISEKAEVYVGCADGTLHILTPKKKSVIQAHRDTILCVVVSDLYFFTASKDGTIKAWDRSTMVQLGQFNCCTSVTTLAVWSSKQRYKKVFYGTSAGLVNVLSWWPKGNCC